VQRTPGGGRFSRKVTGVYYRDSSGRVRVEYAPAAETRGDGRSDPDGGARRVAILLPNPYARTDRVYLVDDEAKLVEKMDFRIYGSFFNATRQLSIPTGSRRFTDFPTAESDSQATACSRIWAASRSAAYEPTEHGLQPR
jgi:hypothetical protein